MSNLETMPEERETSQIELHQLQTETETFRKRKRKQSKPEHLDETNRNIRTKDSRNLTYRNNRTQNTKPNRKQTKKRKSPSTTQFSKNTPSTIAHMTIVPFISILKSVKFHNPISTVAIGLKRNTQQQKKKKKKYCKPGPGGQSYHCSICGVQSNFQY